MLGNGDGTFQSPVAVPVGATTNSAIATDLNGDGIPDLAVGIGSGFTPGAGLVAVMLGNGDGTFQPAVFYGPPLGRGANIAVGDFNGDGKPDLAVVASQLEAVSVFVGKGDGTFSASAPNYLPGSWGSVGVGDFNSDGRLDIVTNTTLLFNKTPVKGQ